MQHPELQLATQDSLRYLVDSLMALEIIRRIEQDLGIKIPMTTLFKTDCIEKLVDFMLDRLILISLTKPSLVSSNKGNTLAEIVL